MVSITLQASFLAAPALKPKLHFLIVLINTSARAPDRVVRMYGAENANVLACNWVPVRPSYSEGQPREKRYHIAWLADSFKALIEKSMSICASSSPGRLPTRLKSPNEA